MYEWQATEYFIAALGHSQYSITSWSTQSLRFEGNLAGKRLQLDGHSAWGKYMVLKWMVPFWSILLGQVKVKAWSRAGMTFNAVSARHRMTPSFSITESVQPVKGLSHLPEVKERCGALFSTSSCKCQASFTLKRRFHKIDLWWYAHNKILDGCHSKLQVSTSEYLWHLKSMPAESWARMNMQTLGS